MMQSFPWRRVTVVAFFVALVLLFAWRLVENVSASGEFTRLFAGAPPAVISYQGVVQAHGSPYNGTGYFKFTIVDSLTGNGTHNYWANDGQASGEPQGAVPLSVRDGLFNVALGDTSLEGMSQPLDETVFAETNTYLRVWFSEGAQGPFAPLEPNLRFTSVAYALRAKYADNSAVGPTGPQGPAGPQGATGPDPLAGISCSAGQILQWNGSAWACANPFQVANSSAVCNSSTQGTLRWNTMIQTLEVCDGAQWNIVTMTPAPVLYSAGAHDGNLGGRSGADALCAAATNKPNNSPHYRAFLSVTADDEVRDMPANYGIPTNVPILAPNSTLLATNWADLLDGSIATSLTAAGVMASNNTLWWSGSNADGSLNTVTNNCAGWTTSSNTGGLGFTNQTGEGGWIAGAQALCYDSTPLLLCLAY